MAKHEMSDVLTSAVMVGQSANLEIITDIPGALSQAVFSRLGIAPGTKNVVQKITVLSDRVGEVVFIITSASGNVVELATTSQVSQLPAGSSLNVALALKSLGYSSVGMFAPCGTGSHGESLRAATQRQTVRHLFFEAERTAVTLNVRDEYGGSTLLCEKPPFTAPRSVFRQLARAKPLVLAATSVKLLDLPLITHLVVRRVGRRFAFVPHVELLTAATLRRQLLLLIRQSHLLQVNEHEAALLLGRPFSIDLMPELSALGADITVVTCGAEGAVLQQQGHDPLVQAAFPSVLQGTSGAGDCFFSALIYALWLNPHGLLTPAEALRLAAWVAAEKLQRAQGPWAGIPSAAECEQQLTQWGLR